MSFSDEAARARPVGAFGFPSFAIAYRCKTSNNAVAYKGVSCDAFVYPRFSESISVFTSAT